MTTFYGDSNLLGSGGGWEEVFDLDITAQSNTDFTSTATAVWDGVTWTRVNHTAALVLRTNGTGLEIKCNDTADIGGGMFDCPGVYAQLDDLFPGYTLDDELILQLYLTNDFSGTTGSKYGGMMVGDDAPGTDSIRWATGKDTANSVVGCARILSDVQTGGNSGTVSIHTYLEGAILRLHGGQVFRSAADGSTLPDIYTSTLYNHCPMDVYGIGGSTRWDAATARLYFIGQNPNATGEEGTVKFRRLKGWRRTIT